jgi:DNA invertase Pin-like site-specific DNA recombinase
MYRENGKITNAHLVKTAMLYIRQSTARQVYENNESTVRQYALKDKLIALGWSAENIVTIDQDLGKSGADSKNRDGFQFLVGEVSNNLVGAVASIECSRLSRSSADWSRLTQFCAYTNTLLIDADGIYDPNDFNDRLLLGLKGTMSEAELHFLQERMRGGLMNKAKRGELKKPVPVGYLYSEDKLIKNPDTEVQNAVELLFEAFRRTGSALGVVRYFRAKGFKFPYKVVKGFHNGEVKWIDLAIHSVINILHNPCYAGVYTYGECQRMWTPDGKKPKMMPRENWYVFIKDHHPAYISLEEFDANERILKENYAQRTDADKRTPPREGAALIQGLAWCGKCGHRMHVKYKWYKGRHIHSYICDRHATEYSGSICQSMSGKAVDDKIVELLKAKLTPEIIAQSIEVQKELDSRQDETLNYYRMRVEKCNYEANIARKRFMSVDPDNRLVALELESAWNIKLKNLDDARNELAEQEESLQRANNERDYSLLDNLAENFSEIFQSKDISNKDRKRMVRYLIEDVVLTRNERSILIQIRYKGHTTQTAEIDAPLPGFEACATKPEVIKIIDSTSETTFVEDIVDILNGQGFKSGKGMPFTPNLVKSVMYKHSIATMKERYLNRGYITIAMKAASMGISTTWLMELIKSGKYQGEHIRVNSRNEYVFPPEQESGVNQCSAQ